MDEVSLNVIEKLRSLYIIFCIVFLTIGLAAIILNIIALWKVFKKAGEKGWKSLIPIYNIYIMYKIAKCTNYFWITLGVALIVQLFPIFMGKNPPTFILVVVVVAVLTIAILLIVLSAKFCSKFAKAFGKDIGYAVGLYFLGQIFILILAFGDAKYQLKDGQKSV